MNKNAIHNTAYNYYLSGYHISIEYLEEMEKLVVESSNTKCHQTSRNKPKQNKYPRRFSQLLGLRRYDDGCRKEASLRALFS